MDFCDAHPAPTAIKNPAEFEDPDAFENNG